MNKWEKAWRYEDLKCHLHHIWWWRLLTDGADAATWSRRELLSYIFELVGIERVIVNTHAKELQAHLAFFRTLSREWAVECMKDLLLVYWRGNLQACKEYAEQLGVGSCIKLLEQFKSYEGLYFCLGDN
ncbi:hypothetical protein K2173_011191 [Erythroxylum novogranatense]|uniref:Uncharacterized protein n=1 Tax=Erythroxylum novogranatense TaxID=1862640 RepID=A0AAV8U810_9ROSI|nr:hypothetical protein K2173_011191 [Erythroxylum novogranatense]